MERYIQIELSASKIELSYEWFLHSLTVCGLAKVAILPLNFIRRTALQLYGKLSYEALNRHFCQTAVPVAQLFKTNKKFL